MQPSEQLYEQIRALGRIQATMDETASVLRCSKRVLQAFFAKDEKAKTEYEDGILEGRASLRRKQFALAEKNATMLIWLGKQYLGQSDKVQGDVSGVVTLSVFSAVPRDKDSEILVGDARVH